MLRHGSVVDHIPRRISAACSLFIERNGRIHCLKLSPLSFFTKYLSIDISDSRSRRTLDPGAIYDDIMVSNYVITFVRARATLILAVFNLAIWCSIAKSPN